MCCFVFRGPEMTWTWTFRYSQDVRVAAKPATPATPATPAERQGRPRHQRSRKARKPRESRKSRTPRTSKRNHVCCHSNSSGRQRNHQKRGNRAQRKQRLRWVPVTAKPPRKVLRARYSKGPDGSSGFCYPRKQTL